MFSVFFVSSSGLKCNRGTKKKKPVPTEVKGFTPSLYCPPSRAMSKNKCHLSFFHSKIKCKAIFNTSLTSTFLIIYKLGILITKNHIPLYKRLKRKQD
jgi:hypothetical protein